MIYNHLVSYFILMGLIRMERGGGRREEMTQMLILNKKNETFARMYEVLIDVESGLIMLARTRQHFLCAATSQRDLLSPDDLSPFRRLFEEAVAHQCAVIFHEMSEGRKVLRD